MLDMTQEELASRAKVTRLTLRKFEAGGKATRPSTAELIRRALEEAGAIFLNDGGEGPGVRLRPVAEEAKLPGADRQAS